MSRQTFRTALVAAGLAGALAVPAAGGAQSDVALEQRTTNVAGYRGVLAWSHYDAARDRYRLFVRQPGQPAAAAPVPDSPAPFDVSLGGSRAGAPTAVYTRCADVGGCDIYRYRIGAAAEEHLTRISAPAADERQPAISRGEIAFIRRERSGRGPVYDTIRLGDPASAGRPTKALVRVDIRRDTLSDPALAFGPRLAKGALAFVLSDPGPYGFARKRVRVLDLDERASVNAYTATSGGANHADITRPSWDAFGGLLYFARTNTGSGRGNRFVRWSHATRRLTYVTGDRQADSTAWISPAAGLFVADAVTDDACLADVNDTPDTSRCRLYTTGPLSFTAQP